MYTTESRKSIITKVRLEQARAGIEAEENWGDLLDDLDVFRYSSESWLGQFLKIFESDTRKWRNPAMSRLICLFILARQSIDCAKAVSLMLRNGMHYYALSPLKDLYEARANAEFIRLDESGQVSADWVHSKLVSDDNSTDVALGANSEHWAKTSDGTTYEHVTERSKNVNRKIRGGAEEWPITMFAGDDWNDVMSKAEWLFHQASAPSHPGGKGVREVPSLGEWIIVSTTLASLAMLAYSTVVEEHRSESAGYDDEINEVRQWSDLKRSYNSLRIATAEAV